MDKRLVAHCKNTAMLKAQNVSLTLFCLLFTFSAFAQPSNDECLDATELNNLSTWCSGEGEFTISDATLSSETLPSCWPLGSAANDVWFSFVAEATDVNISVNGNTDPPLGPEGSLEDPQFALYNGNCSSLNLVECSSDNTGNNRIESITNNLIVGATYFIRIAARDGNVGTFKLCVNNFNAIPEPSGDCSTGVVLCDKSPFNVPSIVGTGLNSNEIDPGSCIGGESSSTWYKWTCDVAGTLAFTLTPNDEDDLDFIVYELPNGIDDCDTKIELRCMASGENVSQPFSTWEICTGATGLNLSSSDVTETPGCAAGDDNFVSAINMEVGKSYAVMINNFDNSGAGFGIEFGGTATFLGPNADFEALEDIICADAAATFTDVSTSVSGITSWEWVFGVDANPATASGEGPHSVTYGSSGVKSIVLQITSEAGCIITHIESIVVEPVPDGELQADSDYCAPDQATGSITVIPTVGDAPFTYEFDNSGLFVSDSVFTNLEIGNYTITIRDANGCEGILDVVIPEGLALDASADPATPPTCNGDSDGSISVTVEISTGTVTYDFGNGPTTNNTLTNIPAGIYSVDVIDGIGCSGTFDIEVPEFPVLEPNEEGIDVSCFSEDDGVALVEPTGGAGGYTYLWNTNDAKEEIDDLPPGTYFVTVTDINGCEVVAEIPIIEPPQLFLNLVDIEDVLCFGDDTGIITVQAAGGTPDFEYSSDGVFFEVSPSIDSLGSGNYSLIVRDSRGCTETLDAFVNQPPPLTVDAGPDQTIHLGDIVELQAIHFPGFRPVSFNWTPIEGILDCTDCDDPTAQPFQTTTYTVEIVDSTMCRSEDSLTIHVILEYPVYTPNVFSPNEDGVNDGFTVFASPAASRIRTLKVFSRWGSMVFEGNDLPIGEPSVGWDGTFKGTLMDPAVFAYFAEIEFIDGAVFIFKGDVTLLR